MARVIGRATKHILLFFGASVILLGLGAVWEMNQLFGSDSHIMCDGTVYATALSPDKKWAAYAFERDCGATTDFASFVIVRDAKEKLDLGADLVTKEIVFEARGDYEPRLNWKANGALQIVFPVGKAPSRREIGSQIFRAGNHPVQYANLP